MNFILDLRQCCFGHVSLPTTITVYFLYNSLFNISIEYNRTETKISQTQKNILLISQITNFTIHKKVTSIGDIE